MKKFFTAFLYSLLGFSVVLAGGAMLLPSDYSVERSRVVDAPIDVVYNTVLDLNSWQHWNPWFLEDAEAEITVGQNMKEMPYVMWNGPTVGMGRLDVFLANPHQEIQSNLRFYIPQDAESIDLWRFTSEGEKTKVTWANQGALDGGITKWLGLFVGQRLGADFEKGLANLEAHIVKN